MLHELAGYAHMPKPLVVLGTFYTLYALFILGRTYREGYFNQILSTIINLLKRKHKHCIMVVLFVIFLIYFIDLPIARQCKEWYNIDIYTLVDFINSMGEGWFIVGLLFTLSIIFDFLGKVKASLILKISYIAAIYAGVFNAVLKFVFNRQRPSIGLQPTNFFYFFISGDNKLSDLTYAYNSMPSGHTITAFAAVIPLFLFIKSHLGRFFILSYAIMVGAARIYTMNHWFSDVIVSALLGGLIGWAIYHANRHRLV